MVLVVSAANAQELPSRKTGLRGIHLKQGVKRSALSGDALTPHLIGEAASCTGSQPCEKYYGGRVLPNAKPYAVMWGSTVDAVVQAQVGGFFQAVTNSPYLDWLTEYDTFINAQVGSKKNSAGTQQLIGRGVFDPTGSVYTITPSFTGKTVTDAQIQAELDAQITAGHLPLPDKNSLYTVFFPKGFTINMGGQVSCVEWCGYHGTYTRGANTSVPYAVIPDFGPSSACSEGCGPVMPDAGVMEILGGVVSHELVESITDTDVGLVADVDFPMAWYDITNGEVADICTDVYASEPSLSGSTSYTVQKIFSNVQNACLSTRANALDFKIWFNPNLATVFAGSSVGVSLPFNTGTTAGAAQTLRFTVSGTPANVVGSVDVSSVSSSGDGGTLTLLATDAGVASSDQVVVVTATGDGGTHSASVLLQVVLPPNEFGFSVPSSVQLVQGGSQPVTVTTETTHGAAGSLTLSTSSLPTGVTQASLTPNPVTSGSASVLTLNASASAPVGSYPVTLFAVAPVGNPYASTVTTEHVANFTLKVVSPDAGSGLESGSDAGSGSVDAGTLADAGSTSDAGAGSGQVSGPPNMGSQFDAGSAPVATTVHKGCGCAADGAGGFDLTGMLALAGIARAALRRRVFPRG